MTLGDLFLILNKNPVIVLFYFTSIPLSAFLAYMLGRDDGHLSPWKYLYTVLVYLSTVPGLFAITLSIYYFLFENRPILDTDLIIQVVPVFSMVLTLWLIRLNVSFDLIPGAKKISGLILIIFIALSFMWIIDRMRFIVFTRMSFSTVIVILIAMIIGLRWGWRRVTS